MKKSVTGCSHAFAWMVLARCMLDPNARSAADGGDDAEWPAASPRSRAPHHESRRDPRTAFLRKLPQIVQSGASVLNRLFGQAQCGLGRSQPAYQIGDAARPGERDPASPRTAACRRADGAERDAADHAFATAGRGTCLRRRVRRGRGDPGWGQGTGAIGERRSYGSFSRSNGGHIANTREPGRASSGGSSSSIAFPAARAAPVSGVGQGARSPLTWSISANLPTRQATRRCLGRGTYILTPNAATSATGALSKPRRSNG